MRNAIACIAAALATLGCAPQEPIDRVVSQLDASARGHVAPLPPPAPRVDTAYTAGSGRDPFSASHPVVAEPRTRRGDPLEAYALDTLRMVGTVAVQGALYALVRSPDGNVHRVRAGDGIGRDYGAVSTVTEAAIVVSEPVIQDGARSTREVRLPLGPA